MDDIGIPMASGTRNINVNQTQADSSDNPKKAYPKKRNTLQISRDHIIAVVIAAIVYIVLWFVSINITNFYCWTRNDYHCYSVDWVHGIFVFGLFAAVIIPTIVGIYYGITASKNVEYIDLQRGITLSRRQLDAYTPQLIEVLNTSARSEATTGINTYSPTYTGVKPEKPIISTPDVAVGLDVVAGLEDMSDKTAYDLLDGGG